MARTTLARTMRMGISVTALLWAGSAWAQSCTVTGTGTLNDLNAGDTVTCGGTISGPIVSNGQGTNETGISIVIDNATVTAGIFSLNAGAPGSQITVSNGSVLTDTGIDISGDFSSLSIDASTVNIGNGYIELFGSNTGVTLSNGAVINTLSGGTGVRLSGNENYLEIDANSAIRAASGTGVLGGNGIQYVVVRGVIDATGGTAVSLGGGNDLLDISNGAVIIGAIDMGANNDVIRMAGSGTVAGPVSGAEELYVLFGSWSMGEVSGVDYAEVSSSGTLTLPAASQFGSTATTINVAQDSVLRDANLGQGQQQIRGEITGDGRLEVHSSDGLVIGRANGFTGGTTIAGGGLLILNHGDALGSGGVVNNGTLRLGNIVFRNSIDGSGGVEVTGGGTAELTAINTYSGGTHIINGVLVVSNERPLGTGAIVIEQGAALRLTPSDPETFTLGISGGGWLEVAGTGQMTFNTANSHSGGTSIISGTVVLNHAGALGTGAVVNNATLRLNGVSFTNAVSGTGAIETSGIASLSGANTHSGGTRVTGGTLSIANMGALGTGTTTVAGGATLDATVATNTTHAGAFSGSGALIKRGTGTLTLTGGGTLGSVTINAGRIALNSNLTGSFTVASGGTLGGTGRAIGNVSNSGTLAPGNSIGTLTVQGNYTHASNAVLEIEFDANGGIDLLDVTGSATINGGTLRFVSLGGAEGQGGTFLRAAGGVTGTFATVETLGAQIPLAVIYTTTTGQMAPSILSARPSTFDSQVLGSADAGLAFAGGLMAAERHGMPGRGRLWIQGVGSQASRDPGAATLGFRHNSWGLAGGADFPLSGGLSLGIAGGGSRGDITLRSGGGGGDIDSLFGALHLRYGNDGLIARGGVMIGSQDQTTRRHVSFNSFSETVTGSTDSTVYGGFAGLTAPVGRIGNWTLSADLSGAWVHQTQAAYREDGTSPLRLSVAARGVDTVEGRLGFDLARAPSAERQSFQPGLRAGVRYLGALGSREIPVTFVASGTPVVLQGDDRDRWEGYAGASARWELRGGIALELGYDGAFGGSSRHEGRASLAFGF
ncbi:autotransporter domain-containing protein [Sphingomonas sp. AOB5]|uniref:autotransporter outer membrane beta-barrel domain-containing protein n=1 Tax=Sphingomonas sp. AOB5 TaxID=3034017 RepID=UPI0023F64E47|nr:autotransporter domain-containing protein [Sphingomonas sp. AOB5]MDF7776094.1 autotransporter domain-containing protein [Sphingomonas sp. AOB5]